MWPFLVLCSWLVLPWHVVMLLRHRRRHWSFFSLFCLLFLFPSCRRLVMVCLVNTDEESSLRRVTSRKEIDSERTAFRVCHKVAIKSVIDLEIRPVVEEGWGEVVIPRSNCLIDLKKWYASASSLLVWMVPCLVSFFLSPSSLLRAYGRRLCGNTIPN